MFEIEIEDETAMLRFGAQLADALGGRGAVLISGDLGAGKTTLCRGLLRQMGHEGSVKSPTFTLVEPYEIEGVCVYHFDLYRLSHPDELDYVGIDEYFSNETLCLVEWPEKAEGSLPSHDLELAIDVAVEKRNIRIGSNSQHGTRICESLKS
jgi:tRNA threonylcarbamoyladenosine biosynthesis protein TsaE